MKIFKTETAYTPQESKRLRNAIHRMTGTLNRGDVVLLALNEDGKWVHAYQRANVQEHWVDNAERLLTELKEVERE